MSDHICHDTAPCRSGDGEPPNFATAFAALKESITDRLLAATDQRLLAAIADSITQDRSR